MDLSYFCKLLWRPSFLWRWEHVQEQQSGNLTVLHISKSARTSQMIKLYMNNYVVQQNQHMTTALITWLIGKVEDLRKIFANRSLFGDCFSLSNTTPKSPCSCVNDGLSYEKTRFCSFSPSLLETESKVHRVLASESCESRARFPCSTAVRNGLLTP